MNAVKLEIPSLVASHKKLIWGSFLAFSLVVFAAVLLKGYLYALALPFAVAFALVAILRPEWIYVLLLGVLPFSIEYDGFISTDLPSEPLAILLTGLVVVYALIHWKELFEQYKREPVLFALLLHIGWIAVACIYSKQPVISVKFLVSKLWYLGAFLFATLFFVRDNKQVRTVFWLMHIPIIITVFYVMWQHSKNDFTFVSINRSIGIVYRNHVNYGAFLSMWLPWQFLALTWYRKTTFKWLFLAFTTVLLLVALYFSYSRGAWVAAIAIPAYYIVARYRLTKWVLIASAVTIIGFGLYLGHEDNHLKYAPNYDTTIFHSDFSEHISKTFSGEDMSTMERFHRWVGAARMSVDEPLTGYGPGNFVHYYKPYTVTAFSTYISDNEEMSTVHNYFLMTLAEQGYIGLAVFLLFTVILLLRGEKLWHSQREQGDRNIVIAMLLCMVAFYGNNLFSDFFEANKLASLFFISLGIMLNMGQRVTNKTLH